MRKHLKQINNLYYNFTKIDSYNKPFNFVISARGSGKTTSAIIDKVYKSFKKGKPYIILRRRKVELNESYIQSFEDKLNEFKIGGEEDFKLNYTKGGLKQGIIDIFIDSNLFARFIALSCNLSDIKSHLLQNIGGVIYDEFICNIAKGEKYLSDEFFTFQELYTTYNRNSLGILKCYFLGNPYSFFNPYFLGFKIDPDAIKKGFVLAYPKGNFALEYYEIPQELKLKIMAKNPLMINLSYKDYAIEGLPVDDNNIFIIKTQPQKAKLARVFYIQNKTIGVYSCAGKIDYWVNFVDQNKIAKRVYCTSINDLATSRVLLGFEDIKRNKNLANSTRLRRVAFANINVYYLYIEIYKLL